MSIETTMKFTRLKTTIRTVALLVPMIFFQTINIWSPQNNLPFFDDNTRTPILEVDNAQGIVHILNSSSFGDNLLIVYNIWSPERKWSKPNDILLPQMSTQAKIQDAYLDDYGTLHIVFFSGDDFAANIYYSRVLASEASDSKAWLKPILIGEGALSPDSGKIFGDAQGRLYIVYTGISAGNGLYYVTSENHGDDWSLPENLFVTTSSDLKPVYLTGYMEPEKQIHITWSVVDFSGYGQAVYYLRYDLKAKQWGNVVTIDQGFGAGADTPAIIEYQDRIFTIYHNDFPTTRYFRYSDDQGTTWSLPQRLFQYEGSNGPAALVIDSSNTLRMFFGNRTGNPAIHGLWQSIWDGSKWSAPEAIVSGPRIVDRLTGGGFDPAFVNAAVLQGNVILLVWRTDPGAGSNGAWFSYIQLDAPKVTSTQIPPPELSATPTATTDLSVNPGQLDTPTPIVQPWNQADSAEPGYIEPMTTILFGASISLLLAIIVMLILKSRR